jgi:hypothetical protein
LKARIVHQVPPRIVLRPTPAAILSEDITSLKFPVQLFLVLSRTGLETAIRIQWTTKDVEPVGIVITTQFERSGERSSLCSVAPWSGAKPPSPVLTMFPKASIRTGVGVRWTVPLSACGPSCRTSRDGIGRTSSVAGMTPEGLLAGATRVLLDTMAFHRPTAPSDWGLLPGENGPLSWLARKLCIRRKRAFRLARETARGPRHVSCVIPSFLTLLRRSSKEPPQYSEARLWFRIVGLRGRRKGGGTMIEEAPTCGWRRTSCHIVVSQSRQW